MSQRGLEIGRSVAGEETLALVREGWILDRPQRIESLDLQLENEEPFGDIHRLLAGLRRYLPVDATGSRLDRCHEAVSVFDRPSLWFNARTYRLLDIRVCGQVMFLRIGSSQYWDCFDFAEGLRHEAADRYLLSKGTKTNGPFRRSLGDPFDLSRRHCGLSFETLTIRVDEAGATFFLLRRGANVAVRQNETSLVPNGEFQPSDDSSFAFGRDLDLWFAMMREYAEEMLGIDEVRQAHGAPIDYDSTSPFQEMQTAKAAGLIRPYLLGIGLEPVSWVAHIYTVCVFDAIAFDWIFAGMTKENLEGVMEVPTHRRSATSPLTGWNFTEDNVAAYLRDRTMCDSAKMILNLAWQHRSTLLK